MTMNFKSVLFPSQHHVLKILGSSHFKDSKYANMKAIKCSIMCLLKVKCQTSFMPLRVCLSCLLLLHSGCLFVALRQVVILFEVACCMLFAARSFCAGLLALVAQLARNCCHSRSWLLFSGGHLLLQFVA